MISVFFYVFDFLKKNNSYWFEHSWEKFRGIHRYNTLKELLDDVKCKFIHYELKEKFDSEKLVIHEYTKPKYHISVQDFYKHCDNGKFVDLNNL